MKDDQLRFMSLHGRLPARLTVDQVAWVINCQPHDVPILFATKLLKPIGNPPPNGTKMVNTDDLLELVKDRAWLVKVTNAIHLHWQRKNAKRKGNVVDAPIEVFGSPAGRRVEVAAG